MHDSYGVPAEVFSGELPYQLPAELPHNLSLIQLPSTLEVISINKAVTHQGNDSSPGPAAHPSCV